MLSDKLEIAVTELGKITLEELTEFESRYGHDMRDTVLQCMTDLAFVLKTVGVKSAD